MPAQSPQDLLSEASCFTCLGVSTADSLALALWDSISQAIAIDPVADFIARAGITEQTEIDAVQALYDAAVANGWWDKCDLIYPFVGGTAQAHAQNLKSSNFTITWNGTVTHDSNGITGDGVTGYGDTGYIPSSSGQVTLDSVHLSRWRRSIGANSRVYCGSSDAGGTIALLKGGIGTTISGSANSPTANSVSSAVLGLSATARNDAADQHFYHDGVDTSTAIASTSIPTMAMLILCQNATGVPSSFTAANISSVTLGSGLTFAEYQLMAADWAAFQTALGR